LTVRAGSLTKYNLYNELLGVFTLGRTGRTTGKTDSEQSPGTRHGITMLTQKTLFDVENE